MLQIRYRVRALPVQIMDGSGFPGLVYFDPLEAPVFKLTISNHLKFGSLYIYYGDSLGETVLQGSDFTIDLQRCHSFSEQSTLFPKGFLIGVDNEEDFNVGYVFLKTYTYYWEV